MPTYCYCCDSCGRGLEVTRPMEESDNPVFCECGPMRRDFRSEHIRKPRQLGNKVIIDMAYRETVEFDSWREAERELEKDGIFVEHLTDTNMRGRSDYERIREKGMRDRKHGPREEKNPTHFSVGG